MNSYNLSPNFESNDYYRILGLEKGATKKQIKQAFNRVIKEAHSDRSHNVELTKKVNHAKNMLLDPEYRAANASEEEEETIYPASGALVAGPTLSEAFKKDLQKWKNEGPSSTENVLFEAPEIVNYSSKIPCASLNLPKKSVQDFLAKKTTDLTPLLDSLSPHPIQEFPEISFELKQLLNTPLPSSLNPKKFNSTPEIRLEKSYFQNEEAMCSAIRMGVLYPANINLPTDKEIEASRALLKDIESKNFYVVEKKIFRTINNFFNKKSAIHGEISLISPESPEAKILKIIPKIPARILKPEEKSSTCCKVCEKALKLFDSSFCSICGKACCGSCLQFQKLPEFSKPIRVCSSHTLQEYGMQWKNALNSEKNYSLVTREYLLMLHVAGYAQQKDFLNWIDKFIDDRSDLACLCCHLGGGDWLDLAIKFLDHHNGSKASACLDQLKKTVIKQASQLTDLEKMDPSLQHLEEGKVQLKVPYSPKDWLREAPDQAARHTYLGLLYYMKSKIGPEGLLRNALMHFQKPFGQALLILARESSVFFDREHIDIPFHISFNKNENKHAALALYFIVKRYSQETWIEYINNYSLEDVEPLLKYMHTHFEGNFDRVALKEDRDYFLWPYLKAPNIDSWLDLLCKDLAKPNLDKRIAYFLEHVGLENLLEKRDAYLTSGEYLKALICHHLNPHSISWDELAKKIQNKFEIAHVLCFAIQSRDIKTLGEQYLEEGKLLKEDKELMNKKGNFEASKELDLQLERKLALAFQCFIYQKDYHRIQDNLSLIDNLLLRLPFHIFLWKQTNSDAEFIEICQILLKHKKFDELQNLLISALQERKIGALLCYQQLMNTPLPIELRIGIIEESSPLCLTKEAKKWRKNLLQDLEIYFKKKLESAFTKASFEELLDLANLITPKTWEMIKAIVEDKRVNSIPGPYKSAVFYMRSLHHLYHPNGPQLWDAMENLLSAMQNSPSEETMPFYSAVIKRISQLPPTSLKFEAGDLAQLNFPNSCQFASRLKGTSVLRLLQLADKSLSKVSSKQAAYSFIDLQMTGLGREGSVGACLSAAFEFLKVLLDLEEPNKIYAYKKGIVQLATTAFAIAFSHLCPSTRLYTYKSCITLLSATFEKAQKISPEEKEFLEILHKEFQDLFEMVPLATRDTFSLFDTFYTNYVLEMFSNDIFKNLQNNPGKSSKLAIQNEILSGSWNRWLNRKDFEFEDARQRSMKVLLEDKGHSNQDVEALMNWPAYKRDEDGWLPAESVPLLLSEHSFSNVESVTFNLKTGAVSFSFSASEDPMEHLFDMQDVGDIFEGAVSSAFFTLKQPDPRWPYHPFQEMAYQPKTISRTNYLGTLLHTDILLKMLSTGTEISGKAPFKLRDIREGLLNRLPEHLRKKYEEYYEKKHIHTAARAHRFWIQANAIDYTVTQSGDEITYAFGACKMSVEKHLLVKDREGNLIDSDQDDDPDSPESAFAKLMTDEYENLGKVFPELARLEQLAKIQAIFQLSLDFMVKPEDITTQTIESEINSVLDYLRKEIVFPSDPVFEFKQILKEQNLSAEQLNESTLHQLQQKAIAVCQNKDKATIEKLKNILSHEFQVGLSKQSLLIKYIEEWLIASSSDSLINLLRSTASPRAQAGNQNICNTFQKAGITFMRKDPSPDNCTWVPAAFKESDYHQVYGGVSMNPNLNRIPCSMEGSSVNRAPLVNRLRYVYTLADGSRHGVLYGVDPVTGNPCNPVFRSRAAVEDQFNNRNNATYWFKSNLPSNTEHYTLHPWGSAHAHGTNGYTTCFKNGQATVYRPGIDKHRCDKC